MDISEDEKENKSSTYRAPKTVAVPYEEKENIFLNQVEDPLLKYEWRVSMIRNLS